ADQKSQYATLTAACAAEVSKTKPVSLAAAQDPAAAAKPADGLAGQQAAMTDLEFQKFRHEGNKLIVDAQAAFGRGETDLAIHMLQDFQARVRASTLSANKQALLLRPVESRLETFAVMKRHTDVL